MCEVNARTFFIIADYCIVFTEIRQKASGFLFISYVGLSVGYKSQSWKLGFINSKNIICQTYL